MLVCVCVAEAAWLEPTRHRKRLLEYTETSARFMFRIYRFDMSPQGHVFTFLNPLPSSTRVKWKTQVGTLHGSVQDLCNLLCSPTSLTLVVTDVLK